MLHYSLEPFTRAIRLPDSPDSPDSLSLQGLLWYGIYMSFEKVFDEKFATAV